MRVHFSKIVSKIKGEVAEDENLRGETTQLNSTRSDKSSLNITGVEGSPMKKSPNKAGGKQVELNESQALADADEELLAAGRFDRQHIIL